MVCLDYQPSRLLLSLKFFDSIAGKESRRFSRFLPRDRENRLESLIAGNLITPDYSAACMDLCDGAFCFGYVGQSRLSDRPYIIQFTPGVNLSSSGDSLGQQYVSPEQAVIERGADVVIVGRGITDAEDVVEAAKQYRSAAWNAYLKRCQSLDD